MLFRLHTDSPGQLRLPGIGARVLADGDQFPRLRFHRSSHPHPARQPVPDPGPVGVDALALQQRRLVGADVVDEREEGGPGVLGHGELGTEVEQVDLADLLAGAHGMCEAEAGALLAGGLAAGSGRDFAAEHRGTSVAGREGEQTANSA